MKQSAKFTHFNLRLLNPSFDSELVDVLNELELLRHSKFETNVNPLIFNQIKHIFHVLESLGSARIEGNHTTLDDYVDSKLTNNTLTEQLKEIVNIENALKFIDDHFQTGEYLSEHFIKELHQLTVHDLHIEGDKTPGAYRKHGIKISGSLHLPPDHIHISSYMSELITFINQVDKPKYDLMKIALAHHRFGWIHPFSNGNGRTVRLLTYALLVKYGFNVKVSGRVLNPTAVFCNNRESYYTMLSEADKGTPESLEKWCFYVLSGILGELKKLDKLMNPDYLSKKILNPALEYVGRMGIIESDIQMKILLFVIAQETLKTGDLKSIFPSLKASQITYQVGKLVNKGLLQPIENRSRTYALRIIDSVLFKGVILSLQDAELINDFN
ncbi:Fic family protein [Orbaceae bacterium ESL0721]|nr:Fic family protein [Orbaceae bacterium ESL0721]